MDAQDILLESRAFYSAHGLDVYNGHLPEGLAITQEQIDAMGAQGFDRAIVMPPVAVQRAAVETLISTLLTAPAANLPPEEQYHTPWVYSLSDIQESTVHNRPEGAYVLFYRSQPYPDETRDLTGPSLQKLFKQHEWRFLTLFEYMVVQRIFVETHGDHRFDHYANHAAGKAGWGWVLDSSKDDRCFHTYWNPNKGQGSVHIGYCKPSNKNARRGAHPVKVVAVA